MFCPDVSATSGWAFRGAFCCGDSTPWSALLAAGKGNCQACGQLLGVCCTGDALHVQHVPPTSFMTGQLWERLHGLLLQLPFRW